MSNTVINITTMIYFQSLNYTHFIMLLVEEKCSMKKIMTLFIDFNRIDRFNSVIFH